MVTSRRASLHVDISGGTSWSRQMCIRFTIYTWAAFPFILGDIDTEAAVLLNFPFCNELTYFLVRTSRTASP